jgi:hypothetical protein
MTSDYSTVYTTEQGSSSVKHKIESYTDFIYKIVSLTPGDAVGRGTAQQAGRSRVRFPDGGPLIFFIDLILPVALWPWG